LPTPWGSGTIGSDLPPHADPERAGSSAAALRTVRMTLSESWIPLDIDAEEPAIPVRPGPGQNVVGMVATPEARERGWTRRAAVEICRGWAQDGSRILLCDVGFEDPELHEVAGLYNQEGVTDALLFGSSFRRLGQPLADGFFLATAGTAVPDPAALRSHPRWGDFAGGFTEAGAVLVLYLPSSAPGVEALYELCDTVVVLGERSEVDGLALSSALGPLAVFGPHPDAGRPALSLDAAVEGEPLEPSRVLEGVAAGTEAEAGDHRAPAGDPGEPQHRSREEAPLVGAKADGPGAPERERGSRPTPGDGGGGSPVLWVGGALILVALILGFAGVIPFPGVGGSASGGEELAPTPEAAAAPAQQEQEEGTADAADPAGTVDTGDPGREAATTNTPTEPRGLEAAPVARYVLAIASYETLSAAFADIVPLRNAMPEAHFVIAPVVVNDRVWYRMTAGTAETSDGIEALRDRLALGRPEAGSWQAREASLGFLVAEYTTFAEADQRVALLAEQDVPGHILSHRDGNGADRFRVYAGAYGTPAEARYLGGFLQEGPPALRDLPLVERRGSRPE